MTIQEYVFNQFVVCLSGHAEERAGNLSFIPCPFKAFGLIFMIERVYFVSITGLEPD